MSKQMCNLAIMLFQKDGIAMKDIAVKLGISQTSARRLKNQYQVYGYIEPTAQRSYKNIKSQRMKQQEQVIRQCITKVISENCLVTATSIVQQLTNRGVFKSRTTVYKHMKDMNYTKKKIRKIPIERNTLEKINQRMEYCQKIKEIPVEKLVFIDESGFNQHTTFDYGWALKGQTPYLKLPANSGKTISLLAAISIRGFEGIRIVEGTTRQEDIAFFFQQQLKHLQMDQVIVMDNARIHHSQTVRDKVKQLGRNVIHLPAYAPQLNPIQNVFSQVKVIFKTRRKLQKMNVKEIKDLVKQSVQSVKQTAFKRYFDHYLQNVERGLRRQEFR